MHIWRIKYDEEVVAGETPEYETHIATIIAPTCNCAVKMFQYNFSGSLIIRKISWYKKVEDWELKTIAWEQEHYDMEDGDG